MMITSGASLIVGLIGKTISSSKIISARHCVASPGIEVVCSYAGFTFIIEMHHYLYRPEELMRRLESDIKGQEEQLLSNVFVQTYKRILKAEEDYEKKQD